MQLDPYGITEQGFTALQILKNLGTTTHKVVFYVINFFSFLRAPLISVIAKMIKQV